MQVSSAGTIYRRALRLVIPFIIIVSLVSGIVTLIVLRAGARSALIENQRFELASTFTAPQRRLDRLTNEVLLLANERAVRAFARETLLPGSGGLERVQLDMAREFAEMLERSPETYIALRYVTFNGAVWTEATIDENGIVQIDRELRQGELSGEPLVMRTAALTPNNALLDGISFRRSPRLSFAERQRPILRIAVPVDTGSDIFSVAGMVILDVDAAALMREIRQAMNSTADFEDGRRLVLVDNRGALLYDTDAPTTDYLLDIFRGTPVLAADVLPEGLLIPQDDLSGLVTGLTITSTFSVPLGTVSNAEAWHAVLIDYELLALANNAVLSIGAFILIQVFSLILILFIGTSLRRALRPIDNVRTTAARLAGEVEALERLPSDLTGSVRATQPAATQSALIPGETITPDVAELLNAFHILSERVITLQRELEAQHGRYTRSIDVAARVSRATASLYNIDELLNRAIRQICEEYGFYHAQVFLIDDVGENAVLVYSYGERGRLLLERGHKLAVGSASVIGRVTQSGRPVIVNDTQTPNSGHKFNPLLPDTRAELAVPLGYADRTIGALDIQSVTPNVFPPEDVRVFQMIADQIAIAIQNVRLLMQSDERFAQIDSLNRQLMRTTLETETADLQGKGYSYDLMQVIPGAPAPPPGAHSEPIRIRGEVIGSMDAAAPGAMLSDSDRALMRTVAERVGIAIENARLFEETQASLFETFTLYQLSRYLNEAATLEEIVSAIASAVMPEAVCGQIAIFDGYPKDEHPQWMEIVADWQLHTRPAREVLLNGLEIHLADHPILNAMTPTDIVLVNDADRDTRLDDTLRSLFGSLGVRAAVLVPFSARGVWRGILMMEFPEARTFTDREGRGYTALIDQAGVAIEARLLLRQNELALADIERLYTGSRIINMAQSLSELVYAAVETRTGRGLDFELGAFVGEVDATGWPTRLHLVARSSEEQIIESDDVIAMPVPLDSPLRRREVVRLQDLESSAQTPLLQYVRARRARTATVLPLFSANQPIALFFILGREARYLSDDDIEVYRALTGQMSIVLQNRRLLDQTARALDETRRLYAATRAITSAPDLQRVYTAAAKGITADVPAISRLSVLTAPGASISARSLDYAYVMLRDESLHNDFAVGMRVPRAAIPFVDIVEDEAGAVHFPDVHADDGGFPALRAMAERSRTRSLILAPMQTRQRFYGIVLIESDQPGAFTEPFVNLAQAITDQLAIAVDGIAAFDEAQLQAQRALALAEAGQLAAAIGGEFVQSIGEVFARVAQPAQYDRWLLVLVDHDGTYLEKVVQRLPGMTQSGNEQEERYSLETDRSPLMLAFLQNQSLLVNEPSAFPTLETLPEPVLDLYGKHLVAPVRLAGRAIGALMVGRARSAVDLDENDEQLVRTLAAQIAIAVENRRLFSAAEAERERLSTVLNTLPAGVAVLDAATFRPIQYNQQAASLLGEALVRQEPLSVETYHLLVSGSGTLYRQDDLPFRRAARSGLPASANDVALLREDGQEFDLLITAAPLLDARGMVSTIVTAFQDISDLRLLERTLEKNLRSTLALYETSRVLSEANTIEEVLEQVMLQISTQEPTYAYIVLLDPNSFALTLARRYDTRPLEEQPPRDPAQLLDWSLPEDILDPEQALVVHDVAAAYELDEAVRLALLKENVQALVSLPLRTRRAVPLGWMVLAFDHVKSFPPDVEQFLVTLNDSAAVALDNRYLFRSTMQALDETGKVYDATAMISRARSLSGISEALQRSLATLKAPIYAGYLRTGSGAMVELFNVAMDSEPIDFAALLAKHPLSELITTFVDDLHALTQPNPLEVALQHLGTLRAISILPLQSQGVVSGVLLLAFHQARRFESGEGRYLSAVADSASVVIDNYLLVERIQSTLEETSGLYLAGRALTDSTEPDKVLEIVTQYLLNPVVTQAFLVQLMTTTWDAPNAMARISAMWTAPDSSVVDLTGITLAAEQFPAWSIFAAPELLIVDDIDEYDGLDETGRAGLYSLDLRSILVLPLRAGGRALGSIVIGSNVARRHEEREIRIYRSFIEQASLRLDANRALRQAERRARQLVTSSEVSQIAGTLLDLDRLLPQIVDLIRDRFEYDHVQIFLMDDKDEFALLRASTGEAGRQLLGIRHKLKKGSQSVIGQVTANARATIAADTADARVVHRPNPYLPNTRSEMAIPLILKGRVVGALDVQSNIPNAFDSDDVLVLTTLAGQVATAIDNAELYEQARGRASEMSFLYSVTNAAARAETLDGAVRNVAEELAHSLSAISAAIYLPETYLDADDQTFTLLVPIAQAGSDQPLSELNEIRLDTAQNLIASAANSRRPLIIPDLSAEPRYLPVVESARSAIIVPLGTASTLVGLITMEGDRPGVFNDETLQLLLTLSGTLSAIVQNQQLLQQVQRQNEDLQELDRLKSDFLANMSHELRTPLNSIIGFSRVILKGIDGPLTEMQEQDLTTIYNSGMHLLNLINDILDQAKIAAGKMDLQFDYFEIRPVIDGVRSIGIGLVKDKPIEIIVNLAPGMPKAYGDEFRIRQVLLNLVSNATKFTREGTITISAYAARDEETGQMMVRIDVTDTGIGIVEKDIPLLFEAFRQVDSSLTRTAGGTGLGLPIAKSLVEIQGGRMLVRSTVNVGSTFSVLLPIEPVVDPDVPPKRKTDDLNATSPSRTAARGVTGHLRTPQESAHDETQDTQTDITRVMTRKRQILLIEDNPEMVDQFRRALAREGYEIFAATIPLEAEAMASGLHPTIIIMDVSFSNGAGWAILRKLQSRDDTMDIPIIVVSLSDQVDEARAAGAFTFIRRPFLPEDIVEAVRQAEAESRVDRILIIDDNPEYVRLIEQILAQHGRFKVFSAHNGMDGIAMVARRRPNLILLDLRMPDMDGFRVIQELRANPETATIPILIVTGEALTNAEREQLMNLAVLFKSNITTNEYRELLDGVDAYLDGD